MALSSDQVRIKQRYQNKPAYGYESTDADSPDSPWGNYTNQTPPLANLIVGSGTPRPAYMNYPGMENQSSPAPTPAPVAAPRAMGSVTPGGMGNLSAPGSPLLPEDPRAKRASLSTEIATLQGQIMRLPYGSPERARMVQDVHDKRRIMDLYSRASAPGPSYAPDAATSADRTMLMRTQALQELDRQQRGLGTTAADMKRRAEISDSVSQIDLSPGGRAQLMQDYETRAPQRAEALRIQQAYREAAAKEASRVEGVVKDREAADLDARTMDKEARKAQIDLVRAKAAQARGAAATAEGQAKMSEITSGATNPKTISNQVELQSDENARSQFYKSLGYSDLSSVADKAAEFLKSPNNWVSGGVVGGRINALNPLSANADIKDLRPVRTQILDRIRAAAKFHPDEARRVAQTVLDSMPSPSEDGTYHYRHSSNLPYTRFLNQLRAELEAIAQGG